MTSENADPGGRPLGFQVDWKPVEVPARSSLTGRRVLLRPVDPESDAEPLYEVSHPPLGDAAIWTYLPDGPYESPAAIYLLAAHVFDDLGYRRLEWKCNALNAGSRRAAERFGFRFEGVFRQHMVVKGANRDTAWYAITDAEWPAAREGFQLWLADENFDESGQQRRALADLIMEARLGEDGA